MLTRTGAPTKEPLADAAEAVAVRGAGHAFGELETIGSLDLAVPRGGVAAWSGPRDAANPPCSS